MTSLQSPSKVQCILSWLERSLEYLCLTCCTNLATGVQSTFEIKIRNEILLKVTCSLCGLVVFFFLEKVPGKVREIRVCPKLTLASTALDLQSASLDLQSASLDLQSASAVSSSCKNLSSLLSIYLFILQHPLAIIMCSQCKDKCKIAEDIKVQYLVMIKRG